MVPNSDKNTIRHDVSVQLDGPSPVPWRLVNVVRGDLLGIRDDGAHGTASVCCGLIMLQTVVWVMAKVEENP